MIRWLDVIRCRVRSLVRRHHADRDLDRELRFHLDERIDELRREGHSAEDARFAALREFGSVASIAEQCRDTRRVGFLNNLAQDLRYAVRVLAAQPTLVAAAAASIGLGIGANLAVFGLANDLLLLMPTAFEPERLVHIRTANGSHVSYVVWRDFDASGVLDGIAGHQIEEGVNWRGPDASVTIMPLMVTANYFDVLRVPLSMGRGFTAREAAAEREPRVAVVSHGFWTRRLNSDPGAVGSFITLNGEPYVVLGILPPNLRSLPGFGIAPDVWLPISKTLMPDLEHPRASTVQLVGRLRDGQTLAEARAGLATVAARLGRHYRDDELGRIRSVTPVGGLGQMTELKEVGAFFGMLLVVTILVLGIACANVAGLLLARGTARGREIALRLALGASRRRIVQQLLAEGFVLSVIGTVTAIVITALVGQLVSRLTLPLPVPFEFHLSFDNRLIVFATTLAFVSTVLSSLIPALQATRPSLTPALKQEVTTYVHRRLTLRALLVGAQVAVSVLLLATTLLFVKNLALARSLEPGFDTDRTAFAQITFVEGRQNLAASNVERIVERLRLLPGVESAAFASGVPLTMQSGWMTGTDLRIEGRTNPLRVEYAGNLVGPDYFRTMDIRIVRGRDFTEHDRSGAPTVIVLNQEFVRRYFDGADPVGRQLSLPGDGDDRPATIIGVVADSKYRSIGEDREPAVYEAYMQRATRSRRIQVVLRTTQPPEALTAAARDAIAQVDRSAAAIVEPMTSALTFAFLPSRIGAALVGTLGALGTLLAMVGLYGIVSFAVSRRTSEIGIRMALGASRRDIMRLVLREGAVLVGAGVVTGLAVAIVATKPLGAFLVAGLDTSDPGNLAATAFVLGLASLAAGWGPARRATRIEPSLSLRVE